MKELRTPMIMGVDMGGTHVRTGLFASEEKPQNKSIKAHYGHLQLQEMIDLVHLEIDGILQNEGLDSSDLCGIGVGFPGHVDFERGIALTTSNLPRWEDDIPLKDILKGQLEIPVYLDNDANLAALAEHRFGAGKGTRNMIYVTIGSGIGAGVIIKGEIYRGNLGIAGEIGHTTLDIDGPVCTCGKRGCLMAMASGIGIVNAAKEAVREGKRTLVTDMVQDDVDGITAEVVADAARRGDRYAGQLIEQAGRCLGIGLANLVEILDPEMIILAGGLCTIGQTFFDLAKKVANERMPKQLRDSVTITRSSLGSDAGIIGAASLVTAETSSNG